MISSVLLDTKNGGLDGLANWPAGPYIVVFGLGEATGSWQFAESQSCNVKRGLGCVFEKSGWYRALASFVCEEFKSSASISTKFHANFAEGHALGFFFFFKNILIFCTHITRYNCHIEQIFATFTLDL